MMAMTERTQKLTGCNVIPTINHHHVPYYSQIGPIPTPSPAIKMAIILGKELPNNNSLLL